MVTCNVNTAARILNSRSILQGTSMHVQNNARPVQICSRFRLECPNICIIMSCHPLLHAPEGRFTVLYLHRADRCNGTTCLRGCSDDPSCTIDLFWKRELLLFFFFFFAPSIGNFQWRHRSMGERDRRDADGCRLWRRGEERNSVLM